MQDTTKPTEVIRPIIVGANARDAREWAKENGMLRVGLMVSAANPQAMRGLHAPVYATPRARTHRNYDQVKEAAATVGVGIPMDRYPRKGRIG